MNTFPDSKVHGANMGPTWVLSAPCCPHEHCYQGLFAILDSEHTKEVIKVNNDNIQWKQFTVAVHVYPQFTVAVHVYQWHNVSHNRSSVNCPHKGQSRGALMSYLICALTNGWVTIRDAGDLRPHRAHYDVIVTNCSFDARTLTKIIRVYWYRLYTNNFLLNSLFNMVLFFRHLIYCQP